MAVESGKERFADHIFCGLAFSDSPVEGCCGDSHERKPVSQRAPLACDEEAPHGSSSADRGPSVVVLFGAGRPPAVRRLVVPVVVAAVDGVVGRGPASHVCKEVLVRVPPLTHRDAPCSVVAEECVARVVAPRKHIRPGAILGGLLPVATLSVPQVGLRAELSAQLRAQASTRLRTTSSQQLCSNRNLLAARASANVGWPVSLAGTFSKNRQPVVNVPN